MPKEPPPSVQRASPCGKRGSATVRWLDGFAEWDWPMEQERSAIAIRSSATVKSNRE